MIVLITGASHTGKTVLAQRLLEQYHYPYLSLDHLKMGLMRSCHTTLTPMSDYEQITEYLWPIALEMIKTAIENEQNLIVEGCYIPFDWAKDFEERYVEQIKYCCLIMSERYIHNHYSDIMKYASIVEKRLDDTYCSIEMLLEDNAALLEKVNKFQCPYQLIDEKYQVDLNYFKNE